MATRLDRQTEVGERILSWSGDVGPSGDSVPLRLAGALHALAIEEKIAPLADIPPENEEALWQACANALRFHSAFILERLQSPPQTNEVRRSAVLLPGFLSIAKMTGKPLVLSEVGASAGLNLQFDRYSPMFSCHRNGAATHPPMSGSTLSTAPAAISTHLIRHPRKIVCG